MITTVDEKFNDILKKLEEITTPVKIPVKRGRPRKGAEIAPPPRPTKTKAKDRKDDGAKPKEPKQPMKKPVSTLNRSLTGRVDELDKQHCGNCDSRDLKVMDVETTDETCNFRFTKLCNECGNYSWFIRYMGRNK